MTMIRRYLKLRSVRYVIRKERNNYFFKEKCILTYIKENRIIIVD